MKKTRNFIISPMAIEQRKENDFEINRKKGLIDNESSNNINNIGFNSDLFMNQGQTSKNMFTNLKYKDNN